MRAAQVAGALWSPEEITLAFLTLNRTPQYVYQSLASLFVADPLAHRLAKICLMVGAEDASYLSDLSNQDKLRIEPLSEGDWKTVKDFDLRRRLNHNYHRCLSIALENSLGLCVCEDDIVFRDGFVAKLVMALNEMASAGLKDFVLSGYAAYEFDRDPSLRRGIHYSSYPANWFYGTQCVFYPQSVLPEIADRIHEEGVVKRVDNVDMLLKKYCIGAQNLYSTRYSIVQHVGRCSTGVGQGPFHTSRSFSTPWPMPDGTTTD